jgi:N6-L-threonylcarbamoyladenine synthase
VNHIEGHIYSNLLERDDDFQYPALVLVASGGHTQLILMREPLSYELIGNTLDDAIGEAFDKSARTLGLGYPGGPLIDKAAQSGNAKAHSFPHVRTERDLDFSFSGLKTAVLRYNQELGLSDLPKDDPRMADFCASLQARLIHELTKKTFLAAERYKVKQIVIAGGVSANSALREQIKSAPAGIAVTMPSLKYCTDNGVMIAAAGTARLRAGQTTLFDVVPNPSLRLVPRI